MSRKTGFSPEWNDTVPPENSYRSIFKSGPSKEFKHPSNAFYEMLKDELELSESDFAHRIHEGFGPVALDRPSAIAPGIVSRFKQICGDENATTDGYSRVKYGHGKSYEEAYQLRRGAIGEVPDIVIHPRNKEDIAAIVGLCNERRIPIYVYGGGSSVVLGLKASRGGVTLVMNTHMNKILKLNEINQTVTVQPGMMGPDFESALNNAKGLYGVQHAYTCGHFPQSFEISSVGGWVLALGSGQASTYYGDAGDLVASMEFVTPSGNFTTREFPASATGPNINDIIKGSEGAFGILVEITMKIFRYMPENRRYFSYMFPDWESAVEASRQVHQGEFGRPAVYRISDPEETDRGLKLFHLPPAVDTIFRLKGLKPMKRCILMGTAEGDRRYTRLVKKSIDRICGKYGAMNLTGLPARQWEKTRYREPLMREDLQDYGIFIDTLETPVPWDNLHHVHREVRGFIKGRPRTVCMTHASHFYPQGTNLYFIFITKLDSLEEYREFQYGIVEAIIRSGSSPSHHHGIGKLFAPFMEAYLGREQMEVLRALKRHFDPNSIMNPGPQLGLDIPENLKRKI